MASTSKDNVVQNSGTHDNPDNDLEPGASHDSILNPTDSFEEFATEMNTSLEGRTKDLTKKSSTISEIQCEIGECSKELKETKSSENLQNKDVSFITTFTNSFIL